ncbi:MAG: ZIP family metal transporter [Thiobacillaceae bacterium]|nr:ZIP family metal transporter [Thiobacillaceae bacterium]MDW8323327.1 ZIP family metal transporter [Burkholderiales bacterium]
MSALAWILLASTLAGVLSMALAAAAMAVRVEWLPVMVSYAIGALLGAAFLEVLPHALEGGGDVHALSATVLAGILSFFVLEKLVLWRHCHTQTCDAHGVGALGHGPSDHGRSGLMITVGDTFHNFVDGVIIAAAFLVDVRLGIVTAIAIIAHELPQEVGDFLILLHSGYSRVQALTLNAASSLATLVGATLGYFALSPLSAALPYILAFAAAGMIYVAVADLIPGLHRRAELRHTAQQIALIALGVATVWLAGSTTHGWLGQAAHAH